MMKTIFVTSFFGLIARNILATNFLRALRSQPNLRIVIFAPVEKRESYRKMFAAPNIEIEGVGRIQNSRLGRVMSSLLLNASDTAARRIHRIIERERYGRYVGSVWHFFVARCSRSRSFRSFLRLLDRLFFRDAMFARYFEKYKPGIVFATDIFELGDVYMIRAAQERKVMVVGMIRSWDNITTKGLNRVVTDKLVVNTPWIKDEAVRYCDFRPENVVVVGVPHYDAYTAEGRIPKDFLFKQLGLNPVKKTVLFAAPSDIYVQGDPITERVVDLMISAGAQVILRLYVVGEVNLGRIKPIPGRLAIDDPGGGGDFVAADLTGKDAHLADLIYHSDLVVAFASTLAIDAVVFDKPVVLIGFDGEDGRPYWKSLRRFYDYDHQRSIIESGGVRLAGTPAEFLHQVKRYLGDPSLDADGRKRIVAERCWKLDGGSGERLAAAILESLSTVS